MKKGGGAMKELQTNQAQLGEAQQAKSFEGGKTIKP